MIRAALPALALAGCMAGPQANDSDARGWAAWHTDKQQVEQAISAALNDGPRPDFARAVAILRASDWPQPVKDQDGGMMVLRSRGAAHAIRPTETLEQGLTLVERAAVMSGETARTVPQQLRLVFERGIGTPPDGIAPDPVIADCWRKLETRWDGRHDVPRVGDPATCVALRRQRLPHPGR